MTRKKLPLLLLFLMLMGYAMAQQSAGYTSDLVDYQEAMALYNNKQYQAAQTLFDKVKDQTDDPQLEADCTYYYANCAVRLNQMNADMLIEDFVERHPTSIKRNSAFLDVANYYFDQGKYAYARKWYDRVDEDNLSIAEREKFSFNYGYALYSTQEQAQAQKYFNRVVNSKEYGSQAKYYMGFMAYEGDNYDQANTYFEQVSDQEKYKEKLSYYQADLNFKLGKFEKAIELAQAQMKKSNPVEKSELSKIIGESYFNLGKYKEAIPYLTAYNGKRGKWNNTDYYQLGYAYYKQGDYEKAISEFNKIISGDNPVAQNAYYHLAESYIHLGKKQEALNAFRNASQMEFDAKIQEDAWLNYAKISYEIGNPYQSVPQVLTGYLNKYPQSAHKTEVEGLLIDSYITSKNYKEALGLLEGKNSFEHKAAFQKVAFFRGTEVYQEGNYQEALSLFEKAVKEPRDPRIAARATFWKAETDYELGHYEAALDGFRQFRQMAEAKNTPEMENIDYHLGYTYFKLKSYSKSTEHFKIYVNQNHNDKLRLNDAYLRLGDGYFVSSEYKDAIAAYDKAIGLRQIETDYADFQKAMSYGYIGQGKTKIAELNRFINAYPKSSLRDDAMYELANSYVKADQTQMAISMYDRLNSEYKNSVFNAKAVLRQGLIYYNSGQNDKALAKFKNVAHAYPNSEEAVQAVATARLIYIDLGRVDEYAAWVKTLGFIEVSDADLDQTTYLAAEKQYLENKTDAAIKGFNAYLNQFPQGMSALKSHFYLGELYVKKGLPDNAQSHYEAVLARNRNEFTEQAMVKLSEIYLNQSQWAKAIPLLQRLEGEADYPQNMVYAQSNLMNAFYQQEKYGEAERYAEKVLSASRLDNKIKSDAQIIIARSAIKTGNQAKAKEAYATLEKIATGALAAEALYYNAYFKNKEGAYESSNATAQKLAKDYGSYKYYSAKGLVLMAKNFYALKDAFQATYILESVISNFGEYPDVVQEAQTQLKAIKTEEAKTNSSINPQN